MKKIILLILLVVIIAFPSCEKKTENFSKEDAYIKELSAVNSVVNKNKLLCLTNDTLRPGLHFEFKSVENLEKLVNVLGKKIKDTLYIHYNPKMADAALSKQEMCSEEEYENLNMIPNDYETVYVNNGTTSHIAFDVETLNPLVSYHVEFDAGPNGDACYDSQYPVQHSSWNHQVNLIGFNPLGCMRALNCRGDDTYSCAQSLLTVDLSWFVFLNTPLGNLSKKVEMKARLWY